MNKKAMQGRVTEALRLKLNKPLTKLMPSRIEYGVEDLRVSFEVSNPLGGFSVVPEDKFAAHRGERQIGVFGPGNPVAALQLLLETYPDATLLLKHDGKKRHKTVSARR